MDSIVTSKRRIFQGLVVQITDPTGSLRNGRMLLCDYGFFRGVLGRDGDYRMWTYFGPDASAPHVYRATIFDGQGAFLRYVWIIGYPSKQAARYIILKHETEGVLGWIDVIPAADFAHTTSEWMLRTNAKYREGRANG